MSWYKFRLPDIGESAAEAQISLWHVAVGDHVKEDRVLVDVTDRALVDLTSPLTGLVNTLYVGDKIALGAVLVEFDLEPSKLGPCATVARSSPSRRRLDTIAVPVGSPF